MKLLTVSLADWIAGMTIFVSPSDAMFTSGSNASAVASFTFFHARSIFSDAVSVELYTLSSAPELFSMAAYMSSNDSWPFWAASNMVTPAFAPNSSIASALVTDPSATPWTNSAKPSFADLPSLVQFATPFFIPARIPLVSAPLFSNCASIAIASSVLNPSSLKLAALELTDCANLLTLIPEACPATVSLSRTSPYSLASMPALFIIFATSCTAAVASCPVTLAYFIADSEASSRASPWSPNRVFSSPTAEPMSPKSPTTLFATSL